MNMSFSISNIDTRRERSNSIEQSPTTLSNSCPKVPVGEHNKVPDPYTVRHGLFNKVYLTFEFTHPDHRADGSEVTVFSRRKSSVQQKEIITD